MQWGPLAVLSCAALCMASAGALDQRAEFGRRLAAFRKLSDNIPDSCMSVCSGLSAVADDFETAESSTPNVSAMQDPKDWAGAFAKIYSDLFGIICAQKDAFKCVVENPIECAIEAPTEEPSPGSGGGVVPDMGLAGLVTQVDCMCTDCPSLPSAMGSFMGWFTGNLLQAFAGLGGGPTAAPISEEDSLAMLCPLIAPLECAAASSSCDAVLASLGSMDPSQVTNMTTQCTAEGYLQKQTNQTDNDTSFLAMTASATIALPFGSIAAAFAVSLLG